MTTKPAPRASTPQSSSRATPTEVESNVTTVVAARIGLDEDQRRQVAQLLTQQLADQHVLYQKTRMCHWNLVGGRFDPLHKMFEAHYEALAEAIDQTAERMRMLDEVAPASMGELLAIARLHEVDGRLIDGQEALTLLLADHESTIRTLREDINSCDDDYDDVGTSDFLTGLLRAHEKTAWMLRSHLEG